MASKESQRKWRRKKRPLKRQLNVMAQSLIHDYLDEIVAAHGLQGKGEAVTFSCFTLKSLMQLAEYNEEAARLIDVFSENFRRDRELYTSSRCPK